MKLATMVIAMILLTPHAAFAGGPPEPPVNGPFSPTFNNSPVTVVLCTVPGACVLHGLGPEPLA